MPTFTPKGDEYLVSSSGTGPVDHGQPRVAAQLANGGYVITWRQYNGDTETVTVLAQVYDASGAPVGNVIRGYSSGGPSDLAIEDVEPLANGNFVITWQPTVRTISAQVYTASGEPVGTGISFAPASQENFGIRNVDTEALPSGGFILTWAHMNEGVRWQVFNETGQAVSQEFSSVTADWGTPSAYMTAYDDGGYALLHTQYLLTLGADPQTRLVLSTYDSNWNLIDTELWPQLPTPYHAMATELESGQLVVVWTTGSGIRAQHFNAQGDKVGGEIVVTTESVAGANVAAHPDGGFVVAWSGTSSNSADTSGTAIKAQAFDADGNGVGGQILVNTTTAGNQTAPDIAFLADGDMVITWVTPDGSLRDVAARLFDSTSSSPQAPIIRGTTGDDTIVGTPGDDTIWGMAGNDRIFGLEGADGLYGDDGDDHLHGGPAGDAVDYLVGGRGNDEFVVSLGDAVVEHELEGFDTVLALTDYILNAGAEIELIMTQNTEVVALVGNEYAQVLVGNGRNNYLDGGGGKDTLIGGTGDDTYLVDEADVVREDVGGGHDNVAAKGNYTLAAWQEIEVLSTTNHGGTSNAVLTGNEFGQTIIGNAGNNYIVGGGGADRLQGLAGNDTYIVDSDDIVLEAVGGGFDNVAASASFALNAGAEVEVLSTNNHGGTAAIDLTGNAFGQSVIGNASANWLNGGLGNDVLQGLGGADTFAFTTALGSGNVDRILDMVSGTDRIALDDAVFTGLAPGGLVDSAFRIGSSAQDADDRIIYDPNTGALFFDADGNGAGAAVQFATLAVGTPLASSDFLVI